ncbi:hypothetical protein BN903_203 [Halorubrum sp. AJ67]|nr:hypothetical protein BN903_203 [Halorubrum sp. AJ67]
MSESGTRLPSLEWRPYPYLRFPERSYTKLRKVLGLVISNHRKGGEYNEAVYDLFDLTVDEGEVAKSLFKTNTL